MYKYHRHIFKNTLSPSIPKTPRSLFPRDLQVYSKHFHSTTVCTIPRMTTAQAASSDPVYETAVLYPAAGKLDEVWYPFRPSFQFLKRQANQSMCSAAAKSLDG
ncbi:hypothetical protein ACMFMG_005567 [Clarireedia jacksonii]